MTARRWPIELLAPARDLDCGRAAIDQGADAVYIGAPQFGARVAAGTSLEDIATLVEYAHRYWVKVYAAMNTILTDAELDEAVHLARQLAHADIDGLIIQDVGLLEMELPPSLPLIASTQMHNRDPMRVRFWSEVGFCRAILARELSLDEIGEVRAAAPDIELECFVHGSLCVSYSGQCYLSYALGGRSGNRGECAQPCRKRYRLEDSQGRILAADAHLLSLCDLNLTDHLEALIEAGVTSFKIEGRLRNRTYVATAVAHYRRALDPILARHGFHRAASGRDSSAFDADPSRVFHRGDTTYFLEGRPRHLATLRTPASLGHVVGRVTRIQGRQVEFIPSDKGRALHAGDGLVYVDGQGEVRGTRVNGATRTRVEVETPEGIAPGTQLHRNHDHEYSNRVRSSKSQRRIRVTMVVRQAHGHWVLQVEDEDSVSATTTLCGSFELARDQDRARDATQRQLRKLGETEFVCVAVAFEVAALPHLPLAVLNEWRREAAERLRQARAASRPKLAARSLRPAKEPRFPQTALDYRANVLNEKAEVFYRRHGAVVTEPAPEAGAKMNGRGVMTLRYCVLHELGWCPKGGGRAPASPPFFLVDSSSRRLQLDVDCSTCETRVLLKPTSQ